MILDRGSSPAGTAATGIAVRPGAKSPARPLSPSVGGETQVLVVEDDEATAEFLLDNLRADGYRAAAASGVGEGLRAIEVRQPDLVLLDLMLDDGHGLELLDAVRSADGLASRLDPELPVIVLSGRTGETDRVRGFARGCDDYVGEAVLVPRAARAHPRRPAPRGRALAAGRHACRTARERGRVWAGW